jgi:hypothetical protein
MNIIEYYYNEDNKNLYIEFSTDDDEDIFYRVLELTKKDIEYYSPTIIIDVNLNDIDDDFIIELITEYLKDNDSPEQQTL